jgi:hypothetical protein
MNPADRQLPTLQQELATTNVSLARRRPSRVWAVASGDVAAGVLAFSPIFCQVRGGAVSLPGASFSGWNIDNAATIN